MTERYIERARLLLQQARYDQAKSELEKALSQEPENAEALGLLAVYYLQKKDFKSALPIAQNALKNNPGDPFLYLITARALFYTNQIPKAQEMIAEGQRIVPTAAAFFEIRSDIAMYQENWEQALSEANKGLELDPEHVELINLRAKALSMLNRQSEAAETLDYALRNAPDNADSHANKGWVLIEQDRYDDAVAAFREALRLNPTSEFAKHGLKEAIKGKNWLYRIVLKYFLAMQKLTEKGQWFVIIGLYVLFQILKALSRSSEQLESLMMPLFVLYLIFVFSSWIARPFSNIFLRFHALGKLALTEDEIKASNVVGALLISGLVLIGLGNGLTEVIGELNAARLFVGGVVCIGLLIPAGGMFAVPEDSKARKILGYYAISLAVFGVMFALTEHMAFGIVLAIGLFAYGWVANYIMSKEARRFN